MFYCKDCEKISRPPLLGEGCSFCEHSENAMPILHEDKVLAAVRYNVLYRILKDRNEYSEDLSQGMEKSLLFIEECDRTISLLLAEWEKSSHLPKSCCSMVGGEFCNKEAAFWYHHNGSVCSYCVEHNYCCGFPLSKDKE